METEVLVGGTDLGTLTMPLRRSLRGYDIVHVQSSPYGAFVSGPRLVVTVHAPVLTEWGHYRMRTKASAIPAYFCERLSFRKARAILAVSDLTRRELTARYRLNDERVHVIGNGVDFDRFANSQQVSRISGRVLLVSRLEPRKRVDIAIRALSRLDPDAYEAEVVGDGSQRRELEEMARRLHANVRFLGRVDESDLPGFYARAGVFLTSSASEGFGLSLLEAMASGCAVIASNIPTHADLLRNGDGGLVYSTPEELESQLRSLVGNATLISKFGKTSQSIARTYSWDEVAKRVLRVYDTVLSGGASQADVRD